MSYLFPVPARPLRSLLDCKASTGGEFTEEEATLDLMLMMDAGKNESLRTLSERWKWSRMTTSRRLEAMQKTVSDWRSWNVGQRGTEVGQRGTKTASEDSENDDVGTEVGQRGTEVGQPLYIHPRASELDRTTELQNNTRKNSDNNEELNAGASAPPSASSSFDLSFLSDRDLNYEPDIRAVLAHYRPTDARDLLVQQWRRRRVPPTNGIAQLLTTHGWEVYAAAVVISSDTDAPNLNFLATICNRLTEQRNGHATKPAQTPTRRPEPSGARPADRADRNTGYNALLLGSSAAAAARGSDGPGGSAAPVSTGTHGPQLRRVV